MEEKEGMNSSVGVPVKGDETSESFRVEPSVENPSQFSGSAVSTTEATPVSVATPATEGKKKRGRPRKYGPDGSVTMALSPMPISASIPLTGDYSAWKQSRGRPIDSYKKKHKLEFESPVPTGDRVAYSVGANFTPHVITVNAGEDVTMKIISFSQQGSRAICVLAANGSISNVTLRQPNSSGGTLTYEGRFEILSLTGSFMPSDNAVAKSRSGGMSVSLAGPDGRVLGGGLAGMLLAAGPVQVVVGSFLPGHQLEQKSKKQKFEQTAIYAAIPAQPLPAERTEGAYSAPRPGLTSSASFHGDDVVSVNALNTKISAPESIVTASAAEYKDQSQSKCEVSC
ncbi:AT-hook motif nuclear-localized protein 6-like isoform X1 [Coffea arabica]|uniref:AT-hook motif nuclear-localized protein n=1 Tax=Coffea arabica TaxID=13443 RepID=A0A6P6VN46_COFAR|nr:AT-hook motif nuclear-localized protein 6-like isoform X1 [Coffea arabica]